MRWLGQHIWDFISRFRNEVYLEDVSTGTIASGGNLGLDANNKIVKNTIDNSSPVIIHQFMGYLSTFTSGRYYYGNNSYGPYHHIWTNNLTSEPADLGDLGPARHTTFLHIVPVNMKNISIRAYCANGASGTNTVNIKVYKCTRPSSVAADQSSLTEVLSVTTDAMDNSNHGFNADGENLTNVGQVNAGEALVIFVIPSGSSTSLRFNYTLYGFTN